MRRGKAGMAEFKMGSGPVFFIRGGAWVGALFCAGVLAVSGCSRETSPLPPSLSPALAYLADSSAKRVYFNAAALPHLVKIAPDWLEGSDRDPRSERVRSMAQAALNPKLFRQLDRQERFDAILLVGDPVQFRPLMEHLIKTQDWALERVDPWSLIYRRGTEETITRESIGRVAAQWDGAASAVRAKALAAMAERLVAAGRLEAGGELVEAARKADGGSVEACAAEGWYRLARGEWKQAIAAAQRGLDLESRNRALLSVKAQGLYFSKRFEEAYEVSRELLAGAPEDPVMLFTHAKIAHEVRSFQEEIQILRKLIGIADREKRSTSWYRVYLGQALATRGEGEAALVELDKALEDSDLPADQRDFASSARARVDLRLHPKQEGRTP